jgi:hypothetical protein
VPPPHPATSSAEVARKTRAAMALEDDTCIALFRLAV